jgi:hypothetical protein
MAKASGRWKVGEVELTGVRRGDGVAVWQEDGEGRGGRCRVQHRAGNLEVVP